MCCLCARPRQRRRRAPHMSAAYLRRWRNTVGRCVYPSLSLYIYRERGRRIYIYIYIYIFLERERERHIYRERDYIMLLTRCLGSRKYNRGPRFSGTRVNNRGVRFHRIRDVKQYYRCLSNKHSSYLWSMSDSLPPP